MVVENVVMNAAAPISQRLHGPSVAAYMSMSWREKATPLSAKRAPVPYMTRAPKARKVKAVTVVAR